MHAVPAGCFASVGQLAVLPVQKSSASHSSTAARQSVVLGLKSSAGHAVLVPSQTSSTSQSPAAGRQSAPALPAGCWQSSELPSH